MQLYEVYYVGSSGCDKEWRLLGKTLATNENEAIEKIAPSDIPRKELAAFSDELPSLLAESVVASVLHTAF